MRTTRTIQISALNIAMHAPHSPVRYEKLLRHAARRRMAVRFGAVHVVRLGSIYAAHERGGVAVIPGELFRFVKLDPNEPWFNEQTHEAATEEDIQEISVPGHLLPHMQTISFVFLPEAHQLWFVQKDRKNSLAAKSAEKFFQDVLDSAARELNFPQVEVTLLPDHDQLERMLSLPQLDRIMISLKRPNADDADAQEQEWMDRLDRQNAGILRQEWVAAKRESIEPDHETRSLAKVAANNGFVKVSGKNAEGVRVVESTKDVPLNERALVNDEIETAKDVLARVALDNVT